MTVKLDEAAVEAAVRAGYAAWMLSPWVGMESPELLDGTEEGYQASWRCETRAAIAAYLAARPTPDAEAMEREFVGALGRYGIARTAYFRGEDVTWRSVQDSEQAVLDLYRKAVRS